MMTPPNCISCNLERELVSVQPTRNRHDVRRYECPRCRSAFRLVVERKRLDLDDLVFDFPARQAVAG